MSNGEKRLIISDHTSHVLVEICKDSLTANVISGHLDRKGFDDGPQLSSHLTSPAGLASRGSSVYIAEHPVDHQGSIRVFQHLHGLKESQIIWHEVSRSFGMASKKEKWQNPADMALEQKSIGLREAKDILEQAGQKLCSIIGILLLSMEACS